MTRARAAGGGSVVQAMNRETLKPVFNRYFKDPVSGMREYYDEKYGGEYFDYLEQPSIQKAELAKYLIKVSIDYLGFQQSDSINESSQRTLNEAYDLVCFLVEMFRPEGKRRYHRDYQELSDREELRM